MKNLDLAAENYDDIQLHGEVVVEQLNTSIQCKSHDGIILEATFEPPFRYLGVGRDKVVVSGLVYGLDTVVGESEPVVAAIALARKNRMAVRSLDGSLHGYRRLRGYVPTAPTYAWYLGSLDGQVVVMPDLTEHGEIVVAQNDRILTPDKIARLQAGFNDLERQLRGFVDDLPFGLMVTFDTYFAILQEGSSRLFLGDFDNIAVSHTTIDVTIQNRRQAEKWLECVSSYVPTCPITYDFQCWANQHEIPPHNK